jgi:Zn-dependent alcohol dehydrogenase
VRALERGCSLRTGDCRLSPSIKLDDVNIGFDRLAEGSAIRQLIEFS